MRRQVHGDRLPFSLRIDVHRILDTINFKYFLMVLDPHREYLLITDAHRFNLLAEVFHGLKQRQLSHPEVRSIVQFGNNNNFDAGCLELHLFFFDF